MKPSHRILVVECMQEISSFNPLPSGYENFRIERGTEMLDHLGRHTALGGALETLQGAGLEPVLCMGARAGSAGLLSAAGWKRLSGEVLESIAAAAKTGVDGVYFSLHGSMGADGELD